MKLRYLPMAFLAGCSSGSAAPSAPRLDGSTEASMTDAARVADDATADAAPVDDATGEAESPCNTIANGAPIVDVVQIAADPPTPQGGTIADGTYWQTGISIYTGPGGPAGATGTSQMTALIQGQTVQLVSDGQPARRTVTLMTADAGFTSVDTCPDSRSSQGAYTATATTLTIFLPGGTDDAGPRTVVETLAKQ